jgi:hypothetical protein
MGVAHHATPTRLAIYPPGQSSTHQGTRPQDQEQAHLIR